MHCAPIGSFEHPTPLFSVMDGPAGDYPQSVTTMSVPEGKWILIVEDDSSISEAICMGLEFEGYSVLEAGNGAIALQKLVPDHLPSVIFLDLNMPVMDGQQFLAELKKVPPFSKIPVVLLTAFTDKADRIVGTAGVLKKPVDLFSLLEFAKRYCEP